MRITAQKKAARANERPQSMEAYMAPAKTDAIVAKPRLLSVVYQAGRGLVVEARFRCGHVQTNVFPHARRDTPKREIKQWVFGWNGAEQCSRCERRGAA